MTPEERTLITGLFDRLRNVNPGQKDQEAEQLIQQSTAAQPDSPYLLVQTLLVQEHALNNAQVRIQQLEKQAAQAAPQGQAGGGGGFLSGLFGHHDAPKPPVGQGQPQQQGAIPPQQLPQNPAYVQSAPPYPSTVGMAPSAGGGFLRSALTTAAGVAGGAVLFQGIENLLGHNSGPFGGGFGGGGGGFFGGGGGGSAAGATAGRRSSRTARSSIITSTSVVAVAAGRTGPSMAAVFWVATAAIRGSSRPAPRITARTRGTSTTAGSTPATRSTGRRPIFRPRTTRRRRTTWRIIRWITLTTAGIATRVVGVAGEMTAATFERGGGEGAHAASGYARRTLGNFGRSRDAPPYPGPDL